MKPYILTFYYLDFFLSLSPIALWCYLILIVNCWCQNTMLQQYLWRFFGKCLLADEQHLIHDFLIYIRIMFLLILKPNYAMSCISAAFWEDSPLIFDTIYLWNCIIFFINILLLLFGFLFSCFLSHGIFQYVSIIHASPSSFGKWISTIKYALQSFQ